MAKRILVLIFLSLVLSSGAFALDVPNGKDLNTGENVTHPPIDITDSIK
jgi:hypothetical protein